MIRKRTWRNELFILLAFLMCIMPACTYSNDLPISSSKVIESSTAEITLTPVMTSSPMPTSPPKKFSRLQLRILNGDMDTVDAWRPYVFAPLIERREAIEELVSSTYKRLINVDLAIDVLCISQFSSEAIFSQQQFLDLIETFLKLDFDYAIRGMARNYRYDVIIEIFRKQGKVAIDRLFSLMILDHDFFASYSLGRIGGKEVLDRLVGIIHSSSITGKSSAMEALGKYGKTFPSDIVFVVHELTNIMNCNYPLDASIREVSTVYGQSQKRNAASYRRTSLHSSSNHKQKHCCYGYTGYMRTHQENCRKPHTFLSGYIG